MSGATWYCKHCGAAVGASGNYFNAPSRVRRRFMWFVVVTAVAVAGAAAGRHLKSPGSEQRVGLVVTSADGTGRLSSLPAATPWPTPSPVPLEEDDQTAGGVASNAAPGVQPLAPALDAGGWASAPRGPLESPAEPPAGSSPSTSAPIVSSGSADIAAGADATLVIAPAGSSLSRAGAAMWTAGRPPGRVILDGQLDDWVSQSIDVAHVAFGQSYWDGPADLSASAFLAFDAANLYVAVRVTDDFFSQPSLGADLHLGDSVEVQLDTDLAGDFSQGVYSDDDWQIGLSPGDFAGQAAEAFVWRPKASATGIRVASRKIESGYIVEAAIPWQLLGLDAAQTSRIGIAVNVSDNDYPGPAQVTMVSSVPSRSWDDPRTFGTLVLKATAPEADARP